MGNEARQWGDKLPHTQMLSDMGAVLDWFTEFYTRDKLKSVKAVMGPFLYQLVCLHPDTVKVVLKSGILIHPFPHSHILKSGTQFTRSPIPMLCTIICLFFTRPEVRSHLQHITTLDRYVNMQPRTLTHAISLHVMSGNYAHAYAVETRPFLLPSNGRAWV